MNTNNTISLFAILKESSQKYFGGFDPQNKQPILVDDPLKAKHYTNKFDINLRPDEKMVELIIAVSAENMTVSAPFKPKKRVLVTA